MFSYPSRRATRNSTTQTRQNVGRKDKLAFTPNIVLFKTQRAASTYEVDDVRLYTGDLRPDRRLSARAAAGAVKATARTARGRRRVNRRVVCVYAHKKRRRSAAIRMRGNDVLRRNRDRSESLIHGLWRGVVFAFRDTSWEETSFEIERKEYGATEESLTPSSW